MDFPVSAKLYNGIVYTIGILIISQAFSYLSFWENLTSIILFIFVSFLTESLSVDIGNNIAISLGFAIGIACAVSFEPAVTAFILFSGSIMRVEYSEFRFLHIFNTCFYKRFFNACAYAIIGYSASWMFNLNFGMQSIFGYFFGFSIINVFLAMASYILSCVIIYAILFSLLKRQSIIQSASENSWVIGTFLAVLPIGMVIAIAYKYYSWFSVLLFMGPLLLARYSFVLYLQMKEHYFKTINSFTRALDAKDRYTNGHSERVAQYAIALAKRMEISDKRIEELKTAALLHDIGKIGIPDTILNNPGQLTFQEFYEIKRHPEIGARIIEEIPFLKQTAVLIRHHHERFDGAGYPDALRDHEIPLESKIIAIADAYDAMTSDRPYRVAMSKSKAVQIIASESGRQFSPEIASAFIEMVKEKDQDVD